MRLKAEKGDKVKVKCGAHEGQRGVVHGVGKERLSILLDSGGIIDLPVADVTNFSLAARKAWVTEPNRGVGRRKGTCLRDRVSVTLRLDRELWERFLGLEESGAIADRTSVINAWFREKLSHAEQGDTRST